MSLKVAIMANGQPKSLPPEREQFFAEHRRRWGAVDMPAARRAKELSENEEVQFSAEIGGNTEIERVLASIPSGIEVIDHSDSTGPHPGRFDFMADRATLRRLGKRDEIKKIAFVPRGVEFFGQKGPADYLNADQIFNDRGIHASGVKVGIIDSLYNRCIMNTDHDVFEYSTVTYTSDPVECDPGASQPCESISDCQAGTPTIEPTCEKIDQPGRVSNISSSGYFCVSRMNSSKSTTKPHASWVASRVTSSDSGTPLHAAEANLVVANDEPNSSGDNHWESTSKYETTIQKLIDRGAKIINESFAVDPDGENSQSYDVWHQIRDRFARESDVLFTKITHNKDDCPLDLNDDGPDTVEEHVTCHAQNVLCVGGSRAQAQGSSTETYDDISDDEMWCNSRWANPGDDREIEEPDVTSEAHDVKMMKTDSTGGFHGNGAGTSFAAPSIAGLIALDVGSCGNFSPKRYRSVIQTAAWHDQELEKDSWPVYPTWPSDAFFSHETDWYGGTGIPEAARLADFCDGDEFDPLLDTSTGDGSWDGSGGDDAPEYIGEPNTTTTNGNNLETDESNLKLNNPQDYVLTMFEELNAGTSLRFTISWNNCPGDGTRVPEKNYDLAACGTRIEEATGNTKETCLAYAESLHDTDEGFEVTIKDGYAWTDLKLHALWEEGDEGCGGQPEPLHWSYVVGDLNN